jgi:hypothetical protein
MKKNTVPSYIITDASKKATLTSFVSIYLTLMYNLDNNYCDNNIDKINSLYIDELSSSGSNDYTSVKLLQIVIKYEKLLLALNDFHLFHSKEIENYLSIHTYEKVMTSSIHLDKLCCIHDFKSLYKSYIEFTLFSDIMFDKIYNLPEKSKLHRAIYENDLINIVYNSLIFGFVKEEWDKEQLIVDVESLLENNVTVSITDTGEYVYDLEENEKENKHIELDEGDTLGPDYISSSSLDYYDFEDYYKL